MRKASDPNLPLPHIPALDPIAFEQSWQDAASLLAALNGASLGAWSWDIDSGQVNWSRGAQALFGLDPNRPLRQPVEYIQLIPEEDRVEVLRLFREVLDGRKPQRSMCHRIRWPDGTLHWLEISGSLQQPTSDGRRRMVGVIRDVTRQRAQEQALKDSQERLNLALESADLGTWDWHIATGILYGSARASALHGLARSRSKASSGNFSSACRKKTARPCATLTRRCWKDAATTTR